MPFDVRLFHTRDWEYNITVEMLLKTRNHVSKGKGWGLEIITSSIVIIAKEKMYRSDLFRVVRMI